VSLIKKYKSTYYLPGVDDRWWADAFKRVVYRRVPRFPRTVQIQTRTGCNGGCIFCPYKDSVGVVPKGTMSDALFEKIVAEIAARGQTRRISPYLMNEPFLDAALVEKARYIRDRVPRGKVNVTSNGGKLTSGIVDDIMRDNPFHEVFLSVQGIEKQAYEDSMRGSLVFEETKRNVEYLIEQRNRHRPGLKITVTMIKTALIDAEAAVRHWRALGADSKYTVLENRGGNVKGFDAINLGKKRVFRDCTRLFKQAYILFNGDMILCCTDYFKTMVLGNVAESSIYEVWNGPRAVEVRRNFLRGDLRGNPLCGRCFVSTVD
jgi:MoaA/NifB/PqqE/SkfB family radical SAM enzyme